MNKLDDVPAIEPLSEASWRRIERAVFAELESAPRREQPRHAQMDRAPAGRRLRWRRPVIGMAGLAAGLAAAAVLVLVLRGDPAGMPQPSRIVTDDAPAALTVGRAALRVAPESAVWVHSGHDHEVMVVLEQGRVDCAVAHDERQPPLVVQAGDVRVEVVGTSFSVLRQDGSARVEVREGVVKVFHDGKRVLVEAGQQWPPEERAPVVEPGAIEPPAPEAPSAEERPAPAEASAPRERPSGAADAVDRASAERERERARQEPRGIGAEPRSALPRDTSPKERYEEAAALEAANPGTAIAIYQELAEGESGWAAPALFAQARLELERGRRGVARRLLRTYLRRYPQGINAPDARALLDVAGR